MPRPPIIRSIRTRLAAIFFLVTALSVGVIYVVVAPPLTSGLQNQKINDLQALVTNKRLAPAIDGAYDVLGGNVSDVATKTQKAANGQAARSCAESGR